MDRNLPILRGRGTADDLPNRFERLHVELEPEEQGDPHRRPTEYLRDASRSALTRNNSPDVGFDWSLNPYRGCEHGCSYCVAPETPVLHSDMAWRPIWEARVGDPLVGFDEFPPVAGQTRKLRRSCVEDIWWSRKPTMRVITERTEVITTAEHRWLQARDFRWSRTDQLIIGHRLRFIGLDQEEEEDRDYQVGYIAGISLGDATFRYEPGQRSDKLGYPQAYWRLALIDQEPLERTARYLRRFEIDLPIRPFSPAHGSRKSLSKIETRSLPKLGMIDVLLCTTRDTRSYKRGFLGGFFDAEGSNGSSLRITQKDRAVLRRVRDYAASLGFRFAIEPRPEERVGSMRLEGSVGDRIRFFGLCKPAIKRKREALFGYTPPTTPDPIVAIEPGPVMDVVDIQTSSRTFYAAGLATHNCYARPTHEYLGFSAGLDFESRILVKEEAPRLLEREIARKKWVPVPIVMSGVTDPYQPVERKLKITRGCLEVLDRARHPVAIITKSRLVERDADLLARLAEVGAACVTVSVTTLDRRLQRALEPRASPPEHRLEAIRNLTAAGVPVAVNVAPIIPGLTDHEIPDILDAAAAAGAVGAGYTVLRLPGAVRPIFLQWMEDHIPDRAGKVKSRLLSLRDGVLYRSEFGTRMRGEGPFAEQIGALFDVARRRVGLDRPSLELSTEHFRRPPPLATGDFDEQLSLL